MMTVLAVMTWSRSGFPANDMALEIGDARLVNMVVLGAYIEYSKVVKMETVKEALKVVLPEAQPSFSAP